MYQFSIWTKTVILSSFLSVSFPSLTDAVLIACSFGSFTTWGNNLSVLGLSAAFVRHARPGSGVGSSRCWIHDQLIWTSRSFSENLLLCSSLTRYELAERQFGSDSQWCDSWSKNAALGNGPLGHLRHMSPSRKLYLEKNGSRRVVYLQTYEIGHLQCLSGSLQPKADSTGTHWSSFWLDWEDKEDQKERKYRIVQSHL